MISQQNRMLAVMRTETDGVLNEFRRLGEMFQLLLKKLPMTTYHDYIKELEYTGFTRESYVGYHVAEFEDKLRDQWSTVEFRERMHKEMMQAIVSRDAIKPTIKTITGT